MWKFPSKEWPDSAVLARDVSPASYPERCIFCKLMQYVYIYLFAETNRAFFRYIAAGNKLKYKALQIENAFSLHFVNNERYGFFSYRYEKEAFLAGKVR